MQDVETQFEFIRYCLRNVPFEQQVPFFKDAEKKAGAEWEKNKAIYDDPANQDAIRKLGFDPAMFTKYFSDPKQKKVHSASVKERYSLRHREKLPKKTMELWLGSSEASLNQSELLLLVAHFESFMKVVHGTFLNACAEKVFERKYRGKTNVSFPVNEIFETGSTSKFRNELIIKEVKWLDSQDIKVRIDYFQEHFCVSFGLPRDLERLVKLMDFRNRITHEIYIHPQAAQREETHEGRSTAVTVVDLEDARRIFKHVPSECVKIGEKQFPAYFNWMG